MDARVKAMYANAEYKFELVDEYSVISHVREDHPVSIQILRELAFIPNPQFPRNGAYLVHLSSGGVTESRCCISEADAREVTVRFILKEVYGILPTLH